MAQSVRDMPAREVIAEMTAGNPDLRRQIALRYMVSGVMLPMDELVITTGAMEALNLCLQVVTEPGDLVAIESPAFYATLQVLERLKLKAVEIPVHPREGIDLEILADRLAHLPIKACWFMSSLQNPLGASMGEAKKQQLYDLLQRHQVPLIEDDVYAELYFTREPPKPVKSHDREGLVMHCGSFSKSLAPGYRVGWVAGGRYAEQITRLKLMTTISLPCRRKPPLPTICSMAATTATCASCATHWRCSRARCSSPPRAISRRVRGLRALLGLLSLVRISRAGGLAAAAATGAGPGHQPGAGADLLGHPTLSQLRAAEPWPSMGHPQ